MGVHIWQATTPMLDKQTDVKHDGFNGRTDRALGLSVLLPCRGAHGMENAGRRAAVAPRLGRSLGTLGMRLG